MNPNTQWDHIELARAKILARQAECDEIYERLLKELRLDKVENKHELDWLLDYCFNHFQPHFLENYLYSINKILDENPHH